MQIDNLKLKCIQNNEKTLIPMNFENEEQKKEDYHCLYQDLVESSSNQDSGDMSHKSMKQCPDIHPQHHN